MWWRQELKQRRLEVAELRRKLSTQIHDEEDSSTAQPQPGPLALPDLPIKELAALGFAAAAIVGPWRAARLALFAPSAIKVVRTAREWLSIGADTLAAPSRSNKNNNSNHNSNGATPPDPSHRANERTIK